MERLAERKETDEHLALLEDYLDRWLRSVREIQSYPIGHPHRQEAPPANLGKGKEWLAYGDRIWRLNNSQSFLPCLDGAGEAMSLLSFRSLD